MAAKTATTGVDNPLKVFSETASKPLAASTTARRRLLPSSEKKQISIAEDAYNGAVDAFKAAQTRGESKEKVDALRDVAREKEEDLKGLQDLCD